MLLDWWSWGWKGREVEYWSPSGWKRLDHPLAWLPDSPALPIHPLPLLEEVLDHQNRPGHQNATGNCVMTPPSKHLLCCLIPQLWSSRPLWQGRHLWSSRPLLPSRPVAGPSPVAGPLPVADPWSVVRSLPVTVPLRTAGPSLVVEPPLAAGPAPAEPAATGRAPAEPCATGAGTGTAGADSIWICRAGEATTVIMRFSWVLDFGGDSWNSRLTTNVPPVLSELSRRLSRWWREEELDGRVSDVFETLPDSARLRELDPPEELGQSRSLCLRSQLWPSRHDDWCLGDSPCLRLRSGVRNLWWPDPWELGRSAAETLEATDLGCDELATVLDRLVLGDSSDLGRLVGKACLGACTSTESSIISVSFLAAFAAAAALRWFLCAVALVCAVHASGSQSWHTRQGLSWVQRGKPTFKRHCWQRRWLSFRRRKWEHSGNFGCDSFDDDLSRDLSAIL